MNIFAVDDDPVLSATMLLDKHIVKMPLECCQMLSIVFSKWYLNHGPVLKKDGTPYRTEKGAFRNHPCTKWVAESDDNIQWLMQHGISLYAKSIHIDMERHTHVNHHWCSLH